MAGGVGGWGWVWVWGRWWWWWCWVCPREGPAGYCSVSFQSLKGCFSCDRMITSPLFQPYLWFYPEEVPLSLRWQTDALGGADTTSEGRGLFVPFGQKKTLRQSPLKIFKIQGVILKPGCTLESSRGLLKWTVASPQSPRCWCIGLGCGLGNGLGSFFTFYFEII